uniref:5-hydroxytryptamine receptor 3A-like isoform X1 n=1 Tax=Doryrhamphus excisus TaxID=161450 RepID=UPI0025AE2C97|nr:5-hydroxytryptamine receptor 3A-like isoform X1 [Doryrhamphus excisus]
MMAQREIDQTFLPYVWIFTSWQNDHIAWQPEDFCGIQSVHLPTEVLWKPDLTIEEMIEKDKAPPSPHLTITSGGRVQVQNDQVLLSTCRMHIYQFPFDHQSCNLSFKSVVHPAQEIQLLHSLGSAEATRWSREVMHTQYEWLFMDMTVANKTVSVFGMEQDMIVYTITMKRRPVLYIINFLLPVLFFLGLDLASFLISDTAGEKLSFKITILLAVTVMQLILNDILPCSSNRIPLIAVYCIGIFALMLLSLLETILAMYLMEKDGRGEDTKTGRHQSLAEDADRWADCEGEDKKTETHCPADEHQPEPMKDAGRTQSWTVEQLSEETREVMNALTLLLGKRMDEGKKSGYWTRVTLQMNRIFFIFYIMAASLFLAIICFLWKSNQDE